MTVISLIRNWTTARYMRFQQWARSSGPAKLTAGLIVGITFVSSVAMIILEMRASARLVEEMDRRLRIDAAVLAYHLERLTLDILVEEQQEPPLVAALPAARLETRAQVTPEEVLADVLPGAYARLVQILKDPAMPGDDGSSRGPAPGGAGSFELGDIDLAGFVFELETPLGHFPVGDQVQLSEPSPAHGPATGTFTRPFGLAGLFPGWILHVGFRNELKKARSMRYLGRLFLLLIIFWGSVLAYRVMDRQVDLARARSAFVSNVSHELKTPLSAIRLYNSLLGEMDSRDAEHEEFHRVIEQEVVRLASMINNVLEFSHMEQGRVRLNPTNVELGPLLSETAQMFRRLHEDRGYNFALVVSEELPPVYADPNAFGQVLANLLDNAVKYSNPHTIWVQAYVAYRATQRFVVVDVQDRGIGIDRDKWHRVFEPFYRAESGLAQRVSGSGLGLAVVRVIVKAHGGHVELESTPGEGTTFRVLLPAEHFAELEDSNSS